LTELDQTPAMLGKSSRRRRVGVIGAVVGVAAAGLAAGVAAERLVLRRTKLSQTELASEPFGEMPFDESLMVPTDRGLQLYAEVVEPTATLASPAAPTLVFVHGFCLDMGTFHFQRRELGEAGRHRMVFYDQPGHGRSNRLKHGEYSLPQLADGLKDVLDTLVPVGPMVLVGHSMGGMTIMALAEAYPEIFSDRVRGVVFISTSAGKLDEVNFGMPDLLARFSRQLLPLISHTGRATSNALDAARRASSDLAWLLTRKYGFGTNRPDPALVSYVEAMNSHTSTDVVARYVHALVSHAGAPALEALRQTRVIAICGEFDQLTPLSHSQEICRVLPGTRLVVVPDTGHVALMERPDIVNDAIITFLEEIS
jgi:pimeloyl-ACP methyl ester carboxylesterase